MSRFRTSQFKCIYIILIDSMHKIHTYIVYILPAVLGGSCSRKLLGLGSKTINSLLFIFVAFLLKLQLLYTLPNNICECLKKYIYFFQRFQNKKLFYEYKTLFTVKVSVLQTKIKNKKKINRCIMGHLPQNKRSYHSSDDYNHDSSNRSTNSQWHSICIRLTRH